MAINKDTGKLCTDEMFLQGRSLEVFCSADPEGPWPANELAVAWFFVLVPVPGYYGLLRGGARILRGFSRR